MTAVMAIPKRNPHPTPLPKEEGTPFPIGGRVGDEGTEPDLLGSNPVAVLDDVEHGTGGIALAAFLAGNDACDTLVILHCADCFNEGAARNVEGVTLDNCHAVNRLNQSADCIVGVPGVGGENASFGAVGSEVGFVEFNDGISSGGNEGGGVNAFAIVADFGEEVLAVDAIAAEEGHAGESSLSHLVDEHGSFSIVTTEVEGFGSLGSH